MAEEDLIFGKKRHFYGGIAPSNMLAFKARFNNNTGNMEITATLPNETVVNGQTLCTVAGAVIRKSTTDYPKNEFDGTEVATITASGTVMDTDVTSDGSYFYAAFPYSHMGVYNRNTKNRTGYGPATAAYIFGYDLDTKDSNPSTRVSYPSDVDNYDYAPAAMNFTTGVFDYGGWPSEAGSNFMPRPCMLKYDGTVDHYLNQNDYTKTIDGEDSSIADSSFGGNAMMEWPKIYTKRWEDNNGIYHFRCSDVKIDNDYDCWCNYDENNNEIDHFYTAIFRSYTTNSRSCSRSSCGATRENSMTTERSLARANGTGWDLEVLADHLLIQDLLVMMGKSTNTQSVYGLGRASNTFVSTGSTNTAGLFSGASDSSASVKVFGMEDWWGDLSRRILGLAVYNGTIYAKITKGTYDGSTVNDYSVGTVTGHVACGNAITAAKYGYISDMTTYPWGRLPCSFGGTSTTYECDYCLISYSTINTYPAAVGGSFNDTLAYKGAFRYNLDYTAASSPNFMTSRLSYKPTKS